MRAGGGLCAVTFRGPIVALFARQYVEMGQRGLRLAEDAECLVQIGEPQQSFLQVGDPNPSVAVGACVSGHEAHSPGVPCWRRCLLSLCEPRVRPRR